MKGTMNLELNWNHKRQKIYQKFGKNLTKKITNKRKNITKKQNITIKRERQRERGEKS